MFINSLIKLFILLKVSIEKILKIVMSMKKTIKESPIRWIPIWIALGAAIGVPMENIPLGVGIGVGIGTLLFLTYHFGSKKIS